MHFYKVIHLRMMKNISNVKKYFVQKKTISINNIKNSIYLNTLNEKTAYYKKWG